MNFLYFIFFFILVTVKNETYPINKTMVIIKLTQNNATKIKMRTVG